MLDSARARLEKSKWMTRSLIFAVSAAFLVTVYLVRTRYVSQEYVDIYRVRQLDLAKVATGLAREKLQADSAMLSLIASAVRQTGAADEISIRDVAQRIVAGSALADRNLNIDVTAEYLLPVEEKLGPGVVLTTEAPSRVVLHTPIAYAGQLRLTLTRPAHAVLASEVHTRIPRDQSTSRTQLVRVAGDSIQTLMWAGPDTSRRPEKRFLAIDSDSASVAHAIGAGRPAAGRGLDFWGREVVFAIDTLGGNVLLVRQRDVRELTLAAHDQVVADGIVVAGGSWLLVTVLIIGYRLARMGRERDLVQLRSEFVAGVSHELRTPLTQIRLFAQLVRDGTMSDPSKVERAMRVVDTEARRLTFLVDNVLGFARIEHRTPGPSAVVINVSRDVAEAVDTYAPVIEGRAKIAVSLPHTLKARIDPGSLRQVVLNLLDNAAKYGPTGQTIEVGAVLERGDVVIWVQDQGPGIPRDARNRVFEPFVRLTQGESAAGTGIGLSIVRELVTSCGGRVEIMGGATGGTRVEVRLPAVFDNVSGERPSAHFKATV